VLAVLSRIPLDPQPPASSSSTVEVRSPMPWAREHPLPDDPAAAGVGRGLVRAYMDEHGVGAVDVAELLVSELVTNAVVHGAPPLLLRMCVHDELGFGVAVEDASPRGPVVQDAAPSWESGRGMALVDALSWAWDTRTTPTGKSVWFSLGPVGAAP
jgi:anti-sigma regulatory factor (Ser/Thr protein kinase)